MEKEISLDSILQPPPFNLAILCVCINFNSFISFFFSRCRKKADLTMEGQFLIRQIYDDEITYNLIGAAVEILSEYSCRVMSCFAFLHCPRDFLMEYICEIWNRKFYRWHAPTLIKFTFPFTYY